MKIAIEAQRIFRTNKHGMDFVALESIRELQKIDRENEYFVFVSPGTDKCLRSSEKPAYHRTEMPHLSFMGTSGAPPCRQIKSSLIYCTVPAIPLLYIVRFRWY